MTRRLFIFGLGFSGLEIARLARADGWTVAGTCTSEDKARRLRELGMRERAGVYPNIYGPI